MHEAQTRGVEMVGLGRFVDLICFELCRCVRASADHSYARVRKVQI